MNELKHLRKQAHLTLAQTAQLLNVPVRTYENWENGLRVPPIYLYEYIIVRLKLVTMEEKEIKDAIQLLKNALKKEV